mmetsp:Transcript_34746/g.104782  ORF Transcript_34746/g.104782 Transcript_34746/m.104782 type:complete len:253 (+) Transcript_34746:856-1614(+)
MSRSNTPASTSGARRPRPLSVDAAHDSASAPRRSASASRDPQSSTTGATDSKHAPLSAGAANPAHARWHALTNDAARRRRARSADHPASTATASSSRSGKRRSLTPSSASTKASGGHSPPLQRNASSSLPGSPRAATARMIRATAACALRRSPSSTESNRLQRPPRAPLFSESGPSGSARSRARRPARASRSASRVFAASSLARRAAAWSDRSSIAARPFFSFFAPDSSRSSSGASQRTNKSKPRSRVARLP